MSAPERFDLAALAPQPWKNGAGLTREIAAGGADAAGEADAAGAFGWRISVAEVERDAPFSAFPGIDRCIVLLEGAGMRLRSRNTAADAIATIDHALTEPLAPFRFDGAIALDATLAGGPSRDFNVMTRRGAFRSEVACLRGPADIRAADVILLFGCTGAWSLDFGAAAPLFLAPLHALLWRTPPAAPLRVAPIGVDAAALLCVRLCHDRSP